MVVLIRLLYLYMPADILIIEFSDASNRPNSNQVKSQMLVSISRLFS